MLFPVLNYGSGTTGSNSDQNVREGLSVSLIDIHLHCLLDSRWCGRGSLLQGSMTCQYGTSQAQSLYEAPEIAECGMIHVRYPP